MIELKKDAVPQVVLNQLFKNTQLQETFGVNTVALVDGIPRTLGVAEMIGHYLDHQMEVIERRTRYRLGKARGQGAHRRGPRHRGGQHRRGGPDHPFLVGHGRGRTGSRRRSLERDPGP